MFGDDSTNYMQEDKKNLRKLSINLSDKNSRMQEELEAVRRKIKSGLDEIQNLKKFIEAKNEHEILLQERVSRHEEIENSLADQLMIYRSKILDAQSYYQVFDVLKITPLLNSPSKIVLKREESQEFTIEFQQGNKKKSYNISSIESVYKHPSKDNRFYVSIEDESSREFQAEDIEKIMQRIREVMQATIRN